MLPTITLFGGTSFTTIAPIPTYRLEMQRNPRQAHIHADVKVKL